VTHTSESYRSLFAQKIYCL